MPQVTHQLYSLQTVFCMRAKQNRNFLRSWKFTVLGEPSTLKALIILQIPHHMSHIWLMTNPPSWLMIHKCKPCKNHRIRNPRSENWAPNVYNWSPFSQPTLLVHITRFPQGVIFTSHHLTSQQIFSLLILPCCLWFHRGSSSRWLLHPSVGPKYGVFDPLPEMSMCQVTWGLINNLDWRWQLDTECQSV